MPIVHTLWSTVGQILTNTDQYVQIPLIHTIHAKTQQYTQIKPILINMYNTIGSITCKYIPVQTITYNTYQYIPMHVIHANTHYIEISTNIDKYLSIWTIYTICTIHTNPYHCYQYVLFKYRPLYTIHTNTYEYIWCTTRARYHVYNICKYIQIQTITYNTYKYIPIQTIHANTHWYMSIQTNTYQYAQYIQYVQYIQNIIKCQYIPIHSNTCNTYQKQYIPIHTKIHTMPIHANTFLHITVS